MHMFGFAKGIDAAEEVPTEAGEDQAAISSSTSDDQLMADMSPMQRLRYQEHQVSYDHSKI